MLIYILISSRPANTGLRSHYHVQKQSQVGGGIKIKFVIHSHLINKQKIKKLPRREIPSMWATEFFPALPFVKEVTIEQNEIKPIWVRLKEFQGWLDCGVPQNNWRTGFIHQYTWSWGTKMFLINELRQLWIRRVYFPFSKLSCLLFC